MKDWYCVLFIYNSVQCVDILGIFLMDFKEDGDNILS